MAPNNSLPIHGSEKTMNLNHLILTNIQSSPYFKNNCYGLKTYHEVIDEIFYQVNHLEPWEKGSRKTAGQTGMCGGVRGVGAGGIVSSAYCLVYKLFTLKLTRKQLMGLCSHKDSPYIRGLGFMYIRYTQPPKDFWEWYEPYLEDEEEVDVKAGGGHIMKIGEMLRQWLVKLEWYSTLFPRIPVPIQKEIEVKLRGWEAEHGVAPTQGIGPNRREPEPQGFGEAERGGGGAGRGRDSPASFRGRGGGFPGSRASPPFDIAKEIESNRKRARSRSRSKERHSHKRRSRSRDKDRHGSRKHKRSRSRDRKRRSHSRERRSRSRDRYQKQRGGNSSSGRDRGGYYEDRHSYREDDRHGGYREDRARESSFERDLRREKERIQRDRERKDRGRYS